MDNKSSQKGAWPGHMNQIHKVTASNDDDNNDEDDIISLKMKITTSACIRLELMLIFPYML